MKLFAYKKRDFISIAVKSGKLLFDFNKALQYYNGNRDIKIEDFLWLEDIIELGLYKRYYLSRLVNFIKKYRLIDECRISSYGYLPVISDAQKIICIGRNYLEHAAELGNKPPEFPIFFFKTNSCLTAHLDKIILPKFDIGRVDHEAELAVIIGKKGKNIPENKARNYIAGYTVFNDITARDLQGQDKSKGRPWARSKSIDTFGPIGPYFIPKDYIKNVCDLRIVCRVNGKIRQEGNTKDMIFRIDKLISYLSMYMTLYPNDIIATGTVPGVSEIKHGDVVEAYIEKIGTLKNRVIKEAD